MVKNLLLDHIELVYKSRLQPLSVADSGQC